MSGDIQINLLTLLFIYLKNKTSSGGPCVRPHAKKGKEKSMNKKTVRDIDVRGKKVLVRCDFNVPLDGDLITDNRRIRGALPTIKYLLDNNAKVILCSHLGRPKGEVNPKYSLKPVAIELSKLLNYFLLLF